MDSFPIRQITTNEALERLHSFQNPPAQPSQGLADSVQSRNSQSLGDPYAETQVLSQSSLSGIALPAHRDIFQQPFSEPEPQSNRIALPSSSHQPSTTSRSIYGAVYPSDPSFPSMRYKSPETHQPRPIRSSPSIPQQPMYYSTSYRKQPQIASRHSMMLSPTYRLPEQTAQRLQGRQSLPTAPQPAISVSYLTNSRVRGRRRSVHANFAVGRKPSAPNSTTSPISFRVTQKPHILNKSVYFTNSSADSSVIPELPPMLNLRTSEETQLEFMDQIPSSLENTDYWSCSVSTQVKTEEMDYKQFVVAVWKVSDT